MAADLRTLNQKIDKGLKNKRCLEDSDKLVKSTHKETINEIKEAKTNSSVEITKQELEKNPWMVWQTKSKWLNSH